MLFGVILPCTILPCLFQKRPSSFFQFCQVENINMDTFWKKNFLIYFSLLSLQTEKKEDDMYQKKYVSCAKYPMSSKFQLFKWKTYLSSFTDKFLKIEEVEYLILC